MLKLDGLWDMFPINLHDLNGQYRHPPENLDWILEQSLRIEIHKTCIINKLKYPAFKK
jgi:hypothetical protein